MKASARLSSAAVWPLVLAVRLYQTVISPWLPPTCRYYPSCSEYAVVALRRHGLFRGSWLAVRRLARCHPWAKGGVDHVPPPHEERAVGTGAATAARPAAWGAPPSTPWTGA